MAIYGPEVPQLLKRIDEEAAKGNFKQKPRGPLGIINFIHKILFVL